MATWKELGRTSRQAAQVLLEGGFLRSSISRSYYAAYAAITGELTGRVTFPAGQQNPRHAQLVSHVRDHLVALTPSQRRRLSRAIRILWKARVDADYVPIASVDATMARDALREVCAVFRELGIEDG
ncbi:MAG: HEPN domain-containing protein [Armatimonadetes bacterium]|nr:HEPN domain-containing protein [Armatimonadota bacterium]